MQDRFNFNAIVTGYYDIDTPDEYAEFEPQIYLENVDIWSGGDIGISRDDLELAIKNQYPNLEKSQFNQIMKFFEDNSNSSDNEAYLTILPHKIIQCTGLKDKNGKLIYEGNIVFVKVETQDFFGDDEYYSERYKGKIIFDKGEFVIDVVDKTKHTISLYRNAKNCEIIGNIYENEGLLKEVNNDNK